MDLEQTRVDIPYRCPFCQQRPAVVGASVHKEQVVIGMYCARCDWALEMTFGLGERNPFHEGYSAARLGGENPYTAKNSGLWDEGRQRAGDDIPF